MKSKIENKPPKNSDDFIKATFQLQNEKPPATVDINNSKFMLIMNHENLQEVVKLDKLLGTGSYGQVYKVTNHEGKESILKKQIIDYGQYAEAPKIQIEAMNKEANIAMTQKTFGGQSKSGPLMIESNNKETWLSMPYLGQTLLDYLKNNKMSFDQRCHLAILVGVAVEQMQSGEASLKKQPIAHIDLKPANIVLLNFGGDPEKQQLQDTIVDIIDYGSVTTENVFKPLSQNEVIGTPVYLPWDFEQTPYTGAQIDLHEYMRILYMPQNFFSYDQYNPQQAIEKTNHKIPSIFNEESLINHQALESLLPKNGEPNLGGRIVQEKLTPLKILKGIISERFANNEIFKTMDPEIKELFFESAPRISALNMLIQAGIKPEKSDLEEIKKNEKASMNHLYKNINHVQTLHSKLDEISKSLHQHKDLDTHHVQIIDDLKKYICLLYHTPLPTLRIGAISNIEINISELEKIVKNKLTNKEENLNEEDLSKFKLLDKINSYKEFFRESDQVKNQSRTIFNHFKALLNANKGNIANEEKHEKYPENYPKF
jgi:serine/threonine protein kinase